MAEQFTSTVSTGSAGSISGTSKNNQFISGAGAAIGTKVVSSGGEGGGQQYTSSVTIGGASMFGGAVKDSLRKFLERRDQRIIDLSLAPGEENVSQLCWGGLNKNNPRTPFGSKFTTRKSETPKNDAPPEDKLFEWREQERFVVKTKITNPADDEQYIWVDVVKAMVVTAPSQEPFNGRTHVFQFNGKRTQIGVDEGGGSGGAEDTADEEEESSGSPTPGPSPASTGTGTTGPSGLGGEPPSGFGGG